MTTATPVAPAAQPEAPAGRTRGQKLARFTVIAAILLIVVMWIYAFVFADKSAIAKVHDTSWSARAAEICDRRNELLAANSADTRENADGSPRAVGIAVANATDIIEAALDEVQAVLPESERDRKLIAEWDQLYRVYIADRRAAEAKLAAGEAAELNETTLEGSPISESIADFTKVNEMNSCATPKGS